jgi:hypothetical protein
MQNAEPHPTSARQRRSIAWPVVASMLPGGVAIAGVGIVFGALTHTNPVLCAALAAATFVGVNVLILREPEAWD